MSREMKDSGIAWIGEIPKGWNCASLLQVLRARISDGPHETPKLVESGIPFISVDSLNDTENIDFEVVKKYISLEDYKLFSKKTFLEKGDILFTKSATIGKTAIVKNDIFMIWSPIAVLKPNDLIYNKYLYLFVSNGYFKDYICQLSTFNTQFNIGMRTLEKAKICFPPLPEQQKIADYLDRKCAEIDELVALQEKMIEELKAYKQSVITEAVTKGLNPNAPMKDSGIAWIGEIPKEWNVIKFFRICSIITDFVASGSFESLRVNVPYLDFPDYAMLVRTIDLSGKGKASEKVYISKHSYDFLKNSNLFGGEIILPNIGASVGDVYIVPQLYEKMSLAPNSIMFKTISYDKYWYYYFFSKAGKQAIFDICQSTAQSKFNKTDLRNIKVCVPSLLEQQQIADYLDRKCAEIDELVAVKQQKIETLKEYKKSLIYEYVTGKKEVI